jgi:hypothetical protein
MVELIGTAVNYKTISWDGVKGASAYTAKARATEWLEASKRVTTRDYGDIPGITKPGHTPSLLEQINYKGPSAETWQAMCQRDVKESQARRKGVKVDRNRAAKVDLSKVEIS